MPEISFVGLLIVAVVAFLAPLLLALSPARRLSATILEIVAAAKQAESCDGCDAGVTGE